MASPAEINQRLPETLPEDFSDWDSEPSTSSVPIDSDGLRRPGSFEEFPEPAPPTPGPEVTTAPVMDQLRGTALPSTTWGTTEDRTFSNQPPSDSPAGTASNSLSYGVEAAHPADEFLFSPQSPNGSVLVGASNGLRIPAPGTPRVDDLIESLRPKLAASRVEKRTGKKWGIVSAVSACSILILAVLAMWLFRPGKPSAAKQAGEPGPTASEAQLTNDIPKPSPSTPTTQNELPTLTQTQPSAVSQPPEGKAQDDPQPEVQSMSEQLAAPTRIPQSIKNPQVENEPPPLAGLATTGSEALGSGSAIASVFTGARPVVRSAPAKPVSISAGVAVGLLIQKTPPIYPAIARASRISGTVEIQATISKTGTIKNARALSGPVMLQQAALDAVRTWRYKPYKLDNEPTEVQTTVTVVFSLGG